MKSWGIPTATLARVLGVSRHYTWQVLNDRAPASPELAWALDQAIVRLADERRRASTVGGRLRAARINAGFTLKQVAAMIGYTWVAVQRWETNVCLPKPGVLWHLRSLYGTEEPWFRPPDSPLYPLQMPPRQPIRITARKPRRV